MKFLYKKHFNAMIMPRNTPYYLVVLRLSFLEVPDVPEVNGPELNNLGTWYSSAKDDRISLQVNNLKWIVFYLQSW